MTTYRWYDGNRSFFPEVNLPYYRITEQSATQLVLDLPADSSWVSLADHVVFTIANGETWYNEVDGKTFYTAGTITGMTCFKANGSKLVEITGLDVDASVAMGHLHYSNAQQQNSYFWDFVLTNDLGGALFIGSGAARSTLEDNFHWNGYVSADDMSTTTGNDTVRAGDGNDFMSDYGGVDLYDGQAGAMDVVSYLGWRHMNILTQRGITADLKSGQVIGPDGNVDTLVKIEGLRGTNFADVMRGNAVNNTFSGAAGDDVLDGRGGFDTAFYGWDNATGIEVNMATGIVRDGFGGRDRLISIERVVGTWGADRFVDTVGAQSFDGGQGDDRFSLGAGNDTVTGGMGADVFTFVGTDFGSDVITDYYRSEGDYIRPTAAASFADLTITTVGDDMVVAYGTSSITLLGYAGQILDANDFQFV